MSDLSHTAEQRRLADLHQYAILDTPPEPHFDDLAALASQICETPLALISLVDAHRQWFKSRIGTYITETPREMGFCQYAIAHPDQLFIIPDAMRDERTARSPLVTQSPGIRFYAGIPLKTPNGNAIGTLCVLDTKPRDLNKQQLDAMRALGRQVVSQLELRRSATENQRLCANAQQTARRAQHAANHDALTGLPNRTLFGERVAKCIQLARKDAANYAVMFLDLDRFKIVNDSLGHAAGDLLLNTVASRLTDLLETIPAASSHTLARFGGDAFMVLLSDVPDRATLDDIVKKSLATLARPFHYGGNVIYPGASIGIVLGDARYTKADDLLRDAESALHHAKSQGRGHTAVFDEKMHQAAVKRLCLEDELRHALERRELLLHYQPIVSLHTKELIGFEALVRWHRNGKLISPADFIPVAEDTGLIVPMGRWVMAEAIRQLAAWKTAFPNHPPLRMAVNLSRRQLQDELLVTDVRRLIQKYKIDPATLMLEITESLIMTDADDAQRVLADLRGLGVKLAMDDFGTGYSSLGCLHDFDLDVLKVDRMFVASLSDRRDNAVLRAIIDLAHGLGMTVVAEGIETTEQAAMLRAADCDFGQGYLFAKPLTVADAEKLIATPTANAKRAA